MSQCILVQSLNYTTIGRTIVIIYEYTCSTSDVSAWHENSRAAIQ